MIVTPNLGLNTYNCKQDNEVSINEYINSTSDNFNVLDETIAKLSKITTISRSEYNALQDKSGIYFVVEDSDI